MLNFFIIPPLSFIIGLIIKNSTNKEIKQYNKWIFLGLFSFMAFCVLYILFLFKSPKLIIFLFSGSAIALFLSFFNKRSGENFIEYFIFMGGVFFLNKVLPSLSITIASIYLMIKASLIKKDVFAKSVEFLLIIFIFLLFNFVDFYKFNFINGAIFCFGGVLGNELLRK